MGPERLSQNISEKLPLLSQKITVLSYCMAKARNHLFLFFLFFFSTTALSVGLGFPHKRCPFCSVQSSCSPLFYTHIPEVQFDIIHPP
jgi:hypothetical protein